MDEKAMAEALKGQFFWEKTTQFAGDNSKEASDLRRVQRKYRDRLHGAPEPVSEEVRQRVDELRHIVAETFEITVEDLDNRTPVKHATPKNFLMWAVCRYFPSVAMSRMAPCVNRHYTTIRHGYDAFEAEAHLYTNLIRKIDERMGYK